ncbi:unnamed protein product, partial [Onchocerca ochengi]|uniref:Uncharacterized protein n=1 Tax=Onchocerca ochengi TaxID=42157 RepID=A0A182EZW4_ONCOC
MPGRRSSRFGYRTNVTVRQQRSIANQTEEERTAAKSEEDKEWLKCEQND